MFRRTLATSTDIREDLFEAVQKGDVQDVRRLLRRRWWLRIGPDMVRGCLPLPSVSGPPSYTLGNAVSSDMTNGRWACFNERLRRLRRRQIPDVLKALVERDADEHIERLVAAWGPSFFVRSWHAVVRTLMGGRRPDLRWWVRRFRHASFPPTPHQGSVDWDDVVMYAAENGCSHALRALLRIPGARPDVHEIELGRTALHMAATQGSVMSVITLIAVSDPRSKDGADRAPWRCAAEQGHVACFNALYPVSDPHDVHSNVVMAAVISSSWPMLEFALRITLDATLSEPTSVDEALLAWAERPWLDDSPVGLQALLPRTDPSFVDERGNTALLIASRFLHPFDGRDAVWTSQERANIVRCLELLIQHNDVGHRNHQGNDAFHLVRCGYAEVDNITSRLAIHEAIDLFADHVDLERVQRMLDAWGDAFCFRRSQARVLRHTLQTMVLEASPVRRARL